MNRKILVSLVIVVALGVALYLKNRKTVPVHDQLIKKLDKVADEIVIVKPDKTNLKIVQDGEKWLINQEAFPGDKNKIDGLIKKIKDLDVVDIVSKKAFYTKYDLSPDKAIDVKLFEQGNLIREVVFGKKSSTNRHTYVRIDNRPEVFLVSGTFDNDFNKTVEDLRDKDIFKVEKDSINAFEVAYRGRKYNLFKKQEAPKVEPPKSPSDPAKKEDKKPEDKWVCQKYPQAKISKRKVETIISSFNPLRADNYPDLKKDKLKRSLASIKLKTMSKEITLNIHYQDKKEKKYIATCSESPYVFTLSEWMAKKFFVKKIKDLKD